MATPEELQDLYNQLGATQQVPVDKEALERELAGAEDADWAREQVKRLDVPRYGRDLEPWLLLLPWRTYDAEDVVPLLLSRL